MGLIRFDDMKVSANTDQPDSAQTETFPSAHVIEQLRRRLISQDSRDSVEIKIAIVGELIYFAYRELMLRRTL